ncbi:hypothetical protein AMATHDRAFT_134646 [Amanita thiersii Skay4041]|uniref:F-box domain-containing protein n=1 Tax=Amanita thiersii Skay4041 TaxID=703135 RepID=A0A2A9NW55_9AGAR|nr:hypothetical protein AMATHDRAFT_134646 [Amanita thiersii Skay4041]
MAILHIPAELAACIFELLDIPSLITCRSVCSTFCILIDSSVALQYKIQLAASGQEEAPSSAGSEAPKATCLETLKQKQRAWANLQWVERMTVSYSYGDLWELYGNVLAQNTSDSSRLLFYQLPSRYRGIKRRDWSVDVRQYRLRDFGMDPAQNLLVLVEYPPRQPGFADLNYRIHLRTLSTGAPHPLAPEPHALTHAKRPAVHGSCSIQTCDDILGIIFDCHEFGETELVIWNWKTGQILLNVLSGDIKTMSFLSERHIILGVLRLSDILEDFEPSLMVVDFIAEPPDLRDLDELENVYTFCFPPLANNIDVLHINIRSDPAPGWAPDRSLSVPFFLARDCRLYVITLLVHTGDNLATEVVFCVLGNTFRSLIRGVSSNQATTQFDWMTWGPDGSRMVIPPFPHSQTWVCYVYGTRYVTFRPSRHHSGYVYVFDFNQYAVRRHQDGMGATGISEVEGEEAPNERQLCVTSATVIEAGKIFRDEVETRLGYLVKAVALPRDTRLSLRWAMCSEDSIIVVVSQRGLEQEKLLC